MTMIASQGHPSKLNSRDSWPAWTLADHWTTSEATDSDPWNEAYFLGFNLGLDRADAAPDSDAPGEIKAAFHAGHVAGLAEVNHRLEEMFNDRAYDGHIITDQDIYRAGGVS